MIIQALRKGLIEHEASDTGGVPRWKSSCPDRLAEATDTKRHLDKRLKACLPQKINRLRRALRRMS